VRGQQRQDRVFVLDERVFATRHGVEQHTQRRHARTVATRETAAVQTDLALVQRLGAANHGLAVVAVTRPDATVHASLVNAGVLDHPTRGEPVVGLVASGGTKKLAYIRRSGRCALTFQHNWEWVTVEGPADIIGPDDAFDGFDAGGVPRLLRDVFVAAGGTHDDWDEYDRVMAADRRAAVLVTPARVTTNG
jgi:PPOX class probable F420-dependent enzyme